MTKLMLLSFVLLVTNAVSAQDFGPLHGQSFGTGSKTVVVILHGDISRGGPANYHYQIANNIAFQNSNVTAIALLRPGYPDGKGRTSPGTNHGRRDQYTASNNKLVAQTLASIKNKHRGKKLIVIGHSGGAAQLGSVIGQNPGLVDTAVLLSCPCHLNNWIKMHPKWRIQWKRSQSPHSFIKNLKPSTKIIAITGSNDKNTFSKLATDYAALARKQGIDATAIIAPGGDHNGNALLLNALYSEIRLEAR